MTKILILEARFYQEIGDNLANAAIAELEKADVDYERIQIPGCFEIPAALAMAVMSEKYNGFIVLGCVIRGETSHYDYVCGESARGVNDIAISKKIALGYGIITAENHEQANVRADAGQKNIGGRATLACLSMVKIKEKLL